MVKRFFVAAVIASVAGACQTPQNQPPPAVWTTNYNVAFDVMVACLAAPPAGAFTAYAPAYPSAGVATIDFIPNTVPQARSRYVVTQMVGNVSQVSWRRFSATGGLDWLDGEARTRAERCGNM